MHKKFYRFDWFIYFSHHKTKNTYPVELNSNLYVFYYKGKSDLFRIDVDVMLSDLNTHQLNQINGPPDHDDTRRVENVEYHRSSIGSYGCVQFTHMKL